MAKYEIETTAGPNETVEDAANVVLKEGHFLFVKRGSHNEQNIFVIPANYVRTIRVATS